MLKRTKGRLLLTLLVITGFAGTLNDTTLTKQERKFAVVQLKDTKNDLLKSIRGLSDKQLNFKPSTKQWSIKEYFYHLILAEAGFWKMLETSMNKPATPEKRLEIKISDDDLLRKIADPAFKAPESLQPGKDKWKSMDEAMIAFKSSRSQHLKYAKTTTEDLRNHLIQLPFGWIDCYQFIIFIAGHSSRYTRQIMEIIAEPGFPKS